MNTKSLFFFETTIQVTLFHLTLHMVLANGRLLTTSVNTGKIRVISKEGYNTYQSADKRSINRSKQNLWYWSRLTFGPMVCCYIKSDGQGLLRFYQTFISILITYLWELPSTTIGLYLRAPLEYPEFMFLAQGHLESRRWGIGKPIWFPHPHHSAATVLKGYLTAKFNILTHFSALIGKYRASTFQLSHKSPNRNPNKWIFITEKDDGFRRPGRANKLLTEKWKVQLNNLLFPNMLFISPAPDLHPHAASLPGHAAAQSRDSPVPGDHAPPREKSGSHQQGGWRVLHPQARLVHLVPEAQQVRPEPALASTVIIL